MHGEASFPGISKVVSCNFTLTHGVTPSTGTLVTVPHTDNVPQYGNLSFQFGNQRVTLRDCAISNATMSRGTSGQLWSLTIADRRWKWQFGIIDGHYNTPVTGDGTDVERPKTPQELAVLLLDAMGEIEYEVFDLPNFGYPQVDWDNANPADELYRLCNKRGAIVVLGLDNRVRIRKRGVGRLLPDGDKMSLDYNFQREVMASQDRIVCAPIRFQVTFDLEAVGLDIDGEIRPIAELDYTPPSIPGVTVTNGWEHAIPPDFLGVGGTYTNAAGVVVPKRELAKLSVFKWYRITKLSNGTLIPYGYTEDMAGPITELEQLLPLYRTLNTWHLTPAPESAKKFDDARIFGQWWAQSLTDENRDASTYYDGKWELDTQQGLVKFDEPVVKKSLDVAGAEAATLSLECTVEVTEKTTGSKAYYAYTGPRIPNTLPTPPDIWDQSELVPRITHNRKTGRVDSNLSKIEDKARSIASRLYSLRTDIELGGGMQYSGLMPIEPDGAIQMVAWSVSANGPTTTIASRNYVDIMPLLSPDHKIRQKWLKENIITTERDAKRKKRYERESTK